MKPITFNHITTNIRDLAKNAKIWDMIRPEQDYIVFFKIIFNIIYNHQEEDKIRHWPHLTHLHVIYFCINFIGCKL